MTVAAVALALDGRVKLLDQTETREGKPHRLGFGESYPQTMCSITDLGRKKFAEYVAALNDYLKPEK